jgi:hypothetical protein
MFRGAQQFSRQIGLLVPPYPGWQHSINKGTYIGCFMKLEGCGPSSSGIVPFCLHFHHQAV